uniref:Snk_6 protein n=1 Tax=Fopius arisanus TaxID=64838 RepID=A0A0C9RPM7_9HYME
MVIIILSFLLLTRAFAQKNTGDFCIMKGGNPGICTELSQCTIIDQQLQNGTLAVARCGWAGFLPIICCPLSSQDISTETLRERSGAKPKVTMHSMFSTSTPLVVPGATKLGLLAMQMCTLYTKSVYTLVIPPILAGDRKPVNTSLCLSKSQKLIVGGTKAEPKEFPHMVAVGYNTGSGIDWGCGGTLVSESFVLTAAHCTFSSNSGFAEWIRVGDLNLRQTTDDAKPQDRKIIKRIHHPSYQASSHYHDIALLKTDIPVNFDSWVRPACLPTARSLEYTGKAIATGWGKVDWNDEEGSNTLLKVTLPVMPPGTCNQTFNGNTINSKLVYGIVDDWQICAGEEGKDTCQGDSGGPLVIPDAANDCMYNVIGVTSVGRLCGTIIPGVYTRVYYYLSWLEEEIWG